MRLLFTIPVWIHGLKGPLASANSQILHNDTNAFPKQVFIFIFHECVMMQILRITKENEISFSDLRYLIKIRFQT